jgi:hypothetical protein
MLIELPDDLIYAVDFRYAKTDVSTLTYCNIFCYSPETKEYKYYASGAAKQNKKDIFNKGFGRRLALKRALSSSGFNKEDKKLIWQKYFSLMDKKLYRKEFSKEVV